MMDVHKLCFIRAEGALYLYAPCFGTQKAATRAQSNIMKQTGYSVLRK